MIILTIRERVMYLKIKDIMNKNIYLLEPFKYNPKSWFIHASNYLSKRKNTYRKSPVIKTSGELIGLVDVFQMKEDIKDNLPPKFIKIPFLYAEDDLNLCKDRKIDEKYIDENCHIFVVDEKGILVGFMPTEVVRLMVNVKYLYTFINAINNVHDGIVLVDKNSKIIYVNDAYSKILDVDKYKIINRFIRKIEPDALILEVLEKRQPIVNTLVKVKSVGKDIVVNICPIMVQDELVGALSIFKDVTEVRTLTRELENMKRLTGYFYNGAVNSQNTLPLSFSNIVGKDERFLRCLKLAAFHTRSQ